MRNTKSIIIHELSKEKEGLTNAEILKNIGNKKVTRQNLKYYLDSLVKSEVIKKSGIKYILLRKTFIVNGGAVIEFQDKLMFLDCPYYGNKCKLCMDNIKRKHNCLFFNDLPDFLKEELTNE